MTMSRWTATTALLVGLTAAALAPTAFAPLALAGDGVVKIGVLGDQAGFSADAGGKGIVTATQMAVEDAGGKAGGMPVEVVFADMQNKPDVAASIARRWFDVEHVDMITDLPVTPVALAVQEIARAQKKVLMISSAATADLTGKACSPYTIHIADDTNALSSGTARAVVQRGGKTWFFVTADFGFGHLMEKAASDVVTASGGTVIGSIKHPTGTGDFSSYLLPAQGSKAQVIGLANVGADTINAIKQAGEFGLVAGGQKLAGMIVFITDIHSLGLKTAQGLIVTEGYYWDQDDGARAFAQRFLARHGKMPTKTQAQSYAAVRHYLKAVDATKTTDSAIVTAKMKETPLDYFGKPVAIRADGRVMYELGLYEVKKPEESKYPWDYYKRLATISAEDAFRPMKDAGCPFVQ
jgi:branched-chain amino acid transport system substrate-binding protein